MYLHKTDALNKLENYKENLIRKELADSTIKRYVFDVSQCLEHLPVHITKEDLIKYKLMIKDNYKTTTINLKVVSINLFLKYIGRYDLKLKRERITEKVDLDNIINKNEFNGIADFCLRTNRLKMYYIIITLAKTGIRINELQFITFENIKKKSIVITNKGRERKIYICNCLRKELLNYCRIENITSGYIFRGAKESSLISRFTINENMKYIARKTGIDESKVHPHAFRHHFAIQFIASGGSLADLCDIMGHSSLEITKIYLKTSCDRKIEILDNLDF